MQVQVEEQHYYQKKYIDKNRFMSYYYQLNFVNDINPKKVLEIGPGNKFFSKLLESKYVVDTMDIDKNIHPAFVGSVDSMPFGDNSYDLVCCFQVLEHLPFNRFEQSLGELQRVTSDFCLISLPYSCLELRFLIQLPLLPEWKAGVVVPKFYKKHRFDGQHYWEVGRRGYSRRMITRTISRFFDIEFVFNPFENHYHLFFCLRKKNAS